MDTGDLFVVDYYILFLESTYRVQYTKTNKEQKREAIPFPSLNYFMNIQKVQFQLHPN